MEEEKKSSKAIKNEAEDSKDKETTSSGEDDEASIAEFYHLLSDNLGNVIGDSQLGGYLYNQVKHGKKTVYSKTIRETKVFEKTFIPVLNNCFKSISKILRDPKKAIRYEQEVVAMEKVKKVNSDTVRHLASHTQFIKTVGEDGSVIPSKLLTTFSEDEVGIYENRFIKTLINRICKFLSLRVQIMKKNLDSYETKSTVVTNDFKMEETKVKIEFTVKMERKQEAEVKQARDTFEKAKELQERFKSLRSSQLMQDLKNYKEVTPPILKTNIITKNPEFKVCYSTWIFLDRYNQLAFDVNVREKKNKYPEDQATDVDRLMTETLGTIMYFNGSQFDEENKPYKEFTTRKAKMLSNMEDEYKFKPDTQKMEQFEMSEYFLNKTQEFYQQSLEDKMNSGMEKKYSLELVFREMQEVVNSIYPPLFEVPQESEYEDVPLPVKLERAKKKAEVLETITRLKEIDYNNTKKEYEDTLSEIQQTEEKIRQQIAREERLRKLAEEKAARAAKRAAEREEAKRIHDELEAKAKAERAKLKAERDAAKAAEKQVMEAAKAKLAERRQKIMAEEAERKAKKKAEREAKAKALAEEKAAQAAEQARLDEEERKLEAEKAHLDAKEILRRRREIIKAKAAAAKAREEAERKAALESEADDDEDENADLRAIDEEMARLDSSVSEDEVADDDDDDDAVMEETLSPKELLARRREAIRQKALRDAAKSAIVDEDAETDSAKDARDLFRAKREENMRAEAERDQMFDNSSDVVRDDASDEEEKPARAVDTSNIMFARNRDLIRRRAAQQQVQPVQQPKDEGEEDPREILRRRREAMRQRSEAVRTAEETASEPKEAIDPKELLRRRREAIRAKAIAAQKAKDE